MSTETPPHRTLDGRIARWHLEHWPTASDVRVAAKLAEEAGEVCGAVIKRDEGRADSFDILDELGDVLIVATVLAARYGLTIEQVRHSRFEEVSQR